MRLIWLILLLVAVSDAEMAQVFMSMVASSNCASSDAAVCLESLFFLE